MAVKSVLAMLAISISLLACASESPVAILMELEGDETHTFVDGIETELDDLYTTLGRVLDAKGKDTRVDLVFDPGLRFSEITDTWGILEAVGFLDVHIYYLSRDRKRMAEITLDSPATSVPIEFRQVLEEKIP